MNDIKTSALLAQLMESAKEIGNKKNPPFTAERFIVAIIDRMTAAAEAPENPEVDALRTAFKDIITDPVKAKESLMTYICQDKGMVFLDDLYMKKKLQEATDLAAKAERSEISAADLLACIVKDPSDAIKPVLAGGTAPKAADAGDEAFIAALETKFDKIFAKADAEVKAEADAQPEKPKPSVNVKAEMAALVSDAKRIREELQGAIYGQDNAINVFVSGYFQASLLSMIDKKRKRPRATFLFAGPPGVGKTFLAEKAAEALKLPFMRFDMSEYCDKEAAIEFCGSDGVYKGSKQGNFTSYVNQHPQCVILFDEIEKAHISIIHLFLQILDAGRIRDSQSDKEISLKDTILIFTTNAGKQLYQDSEERDLSSISRKVVISALEKDVNPATGIPYFPGAICSRFASGNVVMFNHIGAHDLRQIAKKEIQRHGENLKNETGIQLQLEEPVYAALLLSEGTKADARTIRSRAESFFNDELYELFRLVASDSVKTDVDAIEKIKISVDLSNAPEEIAKLFASGEKTRALVLASPETVALCGAKAPDFEFVGVQTCEAAVAALKTKDIDLVLLDVSYGTGDSASLNIEDVASPARDLFHFLREQKNDVPMYLLQTTGAALSDEERISFTSQGVRGVLEISKGKDRFAARLVEIAAILYQQASMLKLARENKLITFETAQTVSRNGKNAQIRLFDFKTVVAVDSEDAKNVLSAVSKPNVRFEDVIGAGDAKKELAYFVSYLKNPKKYMGTGVKAPKGVLLYGPPGTGKTMLAKAMASEAGVTFIAAEGNQFLKKYVGEGAEKVHELFKTARKYAPSILFIDEIDAIAKERRGNNGNGVEETLTSFLTEMDGFISDPSKPVFVLAATNFDVEPGGERSLDPALMRRFDRRVYIDLPDKADRIRFLRMKIAKNQALAISDGQIDNIAMRATGMSLAELDSVVELALRSAIRQESMTVTDAILEEAFETFNSGDVKKWDVSQLERVARHEAGHAFLCWLSGEKPSYITVVARGDHGGYMQRAEQEGKALYTKDELLARIRTSLGGRAAEIAYYGQKDGISTGASGDLASATRVAQQIVCTYGMDDDFGLAVVNGAVAANGAMSVEVRAAVNKILQEQMAKAISLISAHKECVDALVEELLNKNHLNGAEIHEALSRGIKKDLQL